jgi:membrane protease YdiL (CAAX protease family)
MFFRGVLHGWLRNHLRFLPAAAIGGTLFGLSHGVWFTLPLAVFGIMLAWLREKRCGLWGCVAFHATHNAVTLVFLVVSRYGAANGV